MQERLFRSSKRQCAFSFDRVRNGLWEAWQGWLDKYSNWMNDLELQYFPCPPRTPSHNYFDVEQFITINFGQRCYARTAHLR